MFKYKFDDQGYLIKYKARLCARGDLQQTARDTYAATLAIKIFRAMIALIAVWDWETRQWDAVNAFANSNIDEPTYIKPPDGLEDPKDDILFLLLRALYGLKQSPALWYHHLSNTLENLGLVPVPGCECLFTCEYMHLFFFVDDIVVMYERHNERKVDEFQDQFFNIYEMRNLGEIKWFLGIRITRDRSQRQIRLCQDSYIDKLIAKYNIKTSGRMPGSPLDSDVLVKNTEHATPQDILRYQQHVGSINFSAVTTRPDTAFAASKLSEFLTNPSAKHLEAAERVLRYLGHTKYYTIVFNGHTPDPRSAFTASSDASYADDAETRYSSQGYGFKLFNGMVDWKASKQKTVTTSSTEAELLGLSTAAKETMWWNRFLEAIELDLGYTPEIECDNTQTIRVIKNPTSQFTSKLRHVDIHNHWLRQEVKNQSIIIKWVPSNKIIADGLTKALPPQRQKEFVRLLGIEDDRPILNTSNSNSNATNNSDSIPASSNSVSNSASSSAGGSYTKMGPTTSSDHGDSVEDENSNSHKG